ncbi:RND transporter [Marinomonas sp. SBI22]|uniref:efflux RND transporter permease subunit n=1 Tax=unclassified Marinomonas TaxID=196814 RepID=UPI0007AFCF1C|nr:MULTISPECIES: MMPL family transporter [unclassified Marinomonas]KZM38965.1 RND transporter [Marinomonas sp. SBI22]KZM39652.1 RND transporter [Marinomonas sp. SBI8L]
MQPSQKTSDWASRYADWLIRNRWLVLIASVLITLFIASGARLLAFNNDYRVFFSEDNPQLQEFEQLQRTYTKIDNVLFAIEPKDNNAFSNDALAAVEELTEKSWLLPFALRVDSISNFQHTYAEEDDLIVEDLVTGAKDIDALNLQLLKQVALSEPLLADRIVNKEGTVSGVNITFQMPQKSLDEAPQAVNAARALAAEIEAKYDVNVRLTGMVMLSNAFFEATMKDMSTLVPIMYLVIIAIMYLLVRSISATVSAVIVIMLSMMAGMGFAGHFGVQLTPPSASATTIIMTLAVADSIHILVSMFAGMRSGLNKHDALRESIKVNLGPVFLTSVTTAIGFLSMNFSDAPPFHDLGNITAVGVMMAFFLSVTLLPALMAILPAKATKSSTSIGTSMDKLADYVINNQRKILLGSGLITLVLVSSIQMNKLEDNFIGYFDETQDFRVDSDFVTDELTGIYQLQYSLDSGESNGISNPAFLAKLDNFTTWLRTQPEVIHVNSISDTFKRLNMNLHGDDESYYRLPEDPELAAQYLLLYELSLPYGLDLNNQVNVSKSSTQIVVSLQDLGSTQLKAIAERGTQWLQDNAGITAYGVGPAIMFSYIADRNIEGMLVGTGVAMILISLLIGIALRSVKLGFLSLIPNLLPAALAFGLWGLLVGEVNVAVSMVTGMALGIVVDDTVHFLSKYLRVRRQGMSAEKAVRYAFSSVGVAIIVTSVILVAGFGVLAQSSFGMNSNMAVLTAIAIVMALIADFLLLPVLLLKLDKKAYKTEEENASNDSNTRFTAAN